MTTKNNEKENQAISPEYMLSRRAAIKRLGSISAIVTAALFFSNDIIRYGVRQFGDKTTEGLAIAQSQKDDQSSVSDHWDEGTLWPWCVPLNLSVIASEKKRALLSE